ncbi:cupin domain-containing protein [Parasphingorhabdus sp.]|uniref:cupin domain-containing protein n=1 Tax=Parasphingorhabdus sp. TaxID=2709688 RepID=UPI003267F5F9
MNDVPATSIIRFLNMEPHPEGGHFVESHRDEFSTAIYFLLRAGEASHWHRVHRSVEIWHFHAGAPLSLEISSGKASRRSHVLGIDLGADQKPQITVPAGHWQTARSLGEWTLVGCTVAPAFEFANFELAATGWEPED